MLYEITNGSHRSKAFKIYGRTATVKPGKTETLGLLTEPTEAFVAAQKAQGVEMKPAKGSSAPEKASSYTVKNKGHGWFVVMHDGAEVTKSLREDDVEGFADKSADDQAAFVRSRAIDA